MPEGLVSFWPLVTMLLADFQVLVVAVFFEDCFGSSHSKEVMHRDGSREGSRQVVSSSNS